MCLLSSSTFYLLTYNKKFEISETMKLPETGIEPGSFWSKVRCSTNRAIEAFVINHGNLGVYILLLSNCACVCAKKEFLCSFLTKEELAAVVYCVGVAANTSANIFSAKFFSAKFFFGQIFFRPIFFQPNFFSAKFFFRPNFFSAKFFFHQFFFFFKKIDSFCFVRFFTFSTVIAYSSTRIVWFCLKTNFESRMRQKLLNAKWAFFSYTTQDNKCVNRVL